MRFKTAYNVFGTGGSTYEIHHHTWLWIWLVNTATHIKYTCARGDRYVVLSKWIARCRSPIPIFHGLEFRSLESEFWTGFLILFPNWFHQWQVHIGHHFYEGSCHYMGGLIWMILSLRKWKWIPSSSWCPWICCTLRFMLLSCLQFMIFFWLIYLFLVEGKES